MLKTIFLLVFIALSFPSMARDRNQVHLFRSTHPCPATHHITGACPGWVVDHKMPLCAGGLDAPSNMQWQALIPSRKKDKIEIAYCRCLTKASGACVIPTFNNP